MPAVDQTPTFKLNLPTFDLRVWHSYVNENFSTIDAVLQHYLAVENLVGVWHNATEYHTGERAVDAQNGAIYECILDNTSAAVPTTFAQDRESNPAYWGGFTVQEDFKGTWQNSTSYTVQDFVVSGNIYAVCLTSHTSIAAPGVFGDDSVYWIYLINLTGSILPSITGHGSAYIRARPDETAVEYRTPTQVRADLGIANVVTSWNTRIGDVTLNATDIANAGGISSVGGTISGPLTLSNPNNQLAINGANGTNRVIYAYTSGSQRWALTLANSTVEGGSNVGSDFAIYRYTDASALVDAPFLINRATGIITIADGVKLPAGNTTVIDGAAATNRAIVGQTNGSPRWNIILGNVLPESGSNAGSDFSLNRWTDAGAFIDAPLTISRASGAATFTQAVSITGAASITGTASITGAATISSTGTVTTGNINAGGSVPGSPAISVTGTAGNFRSFQLQTGGANRFSTFLDATAEGGSNAGSNLGLNAYADGGASLGSVYSVVRSTRVVTFAVAIVNPSDIRLKTHILPIYNALEVIMKMQAIWYREKAHPEISKLGLVAQDVRKILPEVVHETAEVSEEGDAILGIDYSKIVPMLVAAVKELTERVRILEART